ncbi:MAG: hypothetical protein RIM80_00015 [Alphaproteobacteria bacterium]
MAKTWRSTKWTSAGRKGRRIAMLSALAVGLGLWLSWWATIIVGQ